MTVIEEHELKMKYIAENPYDYKGFCAYCAVNNIAAIPYVTFASVAQRSIPEDERLPETAVLVTEKTNCGGCGGGKVL